MPDSVIPAENQPAAIEAYSEFIVDWNEALLRVPAEHVASRAFAAFIGASFSADSGFTIDTPHAMEVLRAIDSIEARLVALEKRLPPE